MKRIQVQVKDEIKERAEAVLEAEGLDISSLLKIVLTKTANEQRIPIVFKGYGGDAFVKEPEVQHQIPSNPIKQEEKEPVTVAETKASHVKTQNNPFANLAK
jgi:addiction module RelB/DinJ family antitoxin